jgi:hypothetical protein
VISSQYLGRQIREPIKSWKWPREEYVLEKVYKRGKPPFNPFPSVQDIVDATLCPYAIFHKMYHGYHGALGRAPLGLREDGEEGIRLGDFFHDFISYLKTEIIRGDVAPGDAENLLGKYCFSKGIDAETENILASYLRYWFRRKRESLKQLQRQRPRILFEVHVASIYVTFGRTARFPLRGIIDEIDVTNRKIIERTLRGREDDREPPFLEDFQLWLLWKTLSSIDKSLIRNIFNCEGFEDYELIVETPYRDFHVDKNNIQFNTWAEDAFAWINDLTTGNPIAISDAWRCRGHHNRPCRYREEIEECAFKNICYYRRRRYPERREALREAFRPLYHALFNEQIWRHDLMLYQLAYMEQHRDHDLKSELKQLLIGRNVFPAEVVKSLNNRRFVLRIDEDLVAPLSEIIQDEVVNFDIIFGSFSIGLRRKVYLDISKIKDNMIPIYVEGPVDIEGLNALLIKGGLLFKEEPWFLKRIVQRSLFDLEKWGLDRDDRARTHVTIRFIDTLFGPGSLKARGERY